MSFRAKLVVICAISTSRNSIFPGRCRTQINHRIGLPSLKRALYFITRLGGFLFCLAAFGGDGISRTYKYKGFDTYGYLRVEGVIAICVDARNKVKGDWILRVLDREKLKELGPQDGSGKIGGKSNGEGVFINLNPLVFGDNIYLDGKFSSANKINGKWTRYGYYTGKMKKGSFKMVRN